MKMSELFKLIKEQNGYNLETMSKKLSVSQPFLSNIMNNKKKVSNDLYQKMLKAFPTYKDKIIEVYNNNNENNIIKSRGNLTDIREVDYVTLPLYGLASAGNGKINYLDDEVENINIPKIFGNPKKGDFVTKVSGDSMEPNYNDGDLVLVRTSDLIDIRMLNNKEAVINVGEETFLKKIRFEEGTGNLILKSYNPAYSDIKVPNYELDTVRVIGTIGMIIKQFSSY